MRKLVLLCIALFAIAFSNCSTPTVKYMSTKPIVTGKNVKYELVNSSVTSFNVLYYIVGLRLGNYKNYSTLLDEVQVNNSCDLVKNVQLSFGRSEQAIIRVENYGVVAECWKLVSGRKK